ncbi:hypothetical protein HII17_03865 [Thalassotalea sp. M1531]|uniref:PepSY domain-containing protein n=1 Tax=Thalassotalea algicola TaxID=2716224 RepID=A0A7Y0LBK5_9GAMM|nr:PepSY domain-containing protein [Thalassotalea algicola]NMP30691.1 hypothetical protein [Thalassotalea algicola]
MMSVIRKIHKWLAIIVGLQLIIWLSSGLYLNIADATKASGRQYLVKTKPTVVDIASTVSVKSVLTQYPNAQSIKLITLLDKPFFLVTLEKGLYAHFPNRYQLVNAVQGNRIEIDSTFAAELAQASYSGGGDISDVRIIETRPSAFPKQQNASWQISFTDEVSTQVYIEADSGRLIGHSNDHKALAGLMLMLHFMDYGRIGSFNSWQMIFFALIALWLSISGMIMAVTFTKRNVQRLKI